MVAECTLQVAQLSSASSRHLDRTVSSKHLTWTRFPSGFWDWTEPPVGSSVYVTVSHQALLLVWALRGTLHDTSPANPRTLKPCPLSTSLPAGKVFLAEVFHLRLGLLL